MPWFHPPRARQTASTPATRPARCEATSPRRRRGAPFPPLSRIAPKKPILWLGLLLGAAVACSDLPTWSAHDEPPSHHCLSSNPPRGWVERCDAWRNHPDPPPNEPPVATFTVACDGPACAFRDESSDPDGSVVAWSWTFGDGGASSEQHPSHTYAAAGTYTVALTVTDDAGDTGEAQQELTVAAPAVEEDPPPDDPVTGSSSAGIWISPAELASRPTSGASWDNVKKAADTNLGGGELTVRDDHNNRVLAAALVAARLDDDGYRARVRDALLDVVAAPLKDGDGLAANRRLGTYAIAADLIGLDGFDPVAGATFRTWLQWVTEFDFKGGAGGGTIAAYHERRPNNYGTHAGASRMAAALYLGDTEEFERAVTVFRGWLGDRAFYAGFRYGDLDWQCDGAAPVGINPEGCTRDGHSIDGVLPDDQRRGGGFKWPPPKENYVYEALQGVMVMAVLAHRQGYDVWEWSDRAILRAFRWLHEQADFPAVGDDTWQPHVVNHYYGTSFPAPVPSRHGKNMGWTDWTH